MNEEWRPVIGYEGYYEVSNCGNVRSVDRTLIYKDGSKFRKKSRPIKQTLRNGYCIVQLNKKHERHTKQVHRLVAEAFIGNPSGLPVINHLDCNKQNNVVDNLEWCTQKHNVMYSVDSMRRPKNICKPTCTGHKYIRMKKGRFRVSIQQFGVDKSFGTLDEALKFRDEVMEREKEYYARGQ